MTYDDEIPVADLELNTPQDSLSESGRIYSTIADEVDLPEFFHQEQDLAWNEELITFLGRLAIERERFCKPTYLNELVPALKAASNIVNDLFVFVTNQVDWNDGTSSMEEFTQRASAFLAQVADVTRSTSTSWWGLLSGKNQKNNIDLSNAAVLFYEFTNVLEQGFFSLGNRFHIVEYRLQWVKSCAVFITEIRNDLKWADQARN